jgi:glucose-1-phosphate cytidylyltransferase
LIDDAAVLEEESLEQLAKENDLMAFKHTGFWQCMDTLRDKHYLQQLWDSKQAPWAIPN